MATGPTQTTPTTYPFRSRFIPNLINSLLINVHNLPPNTNHITRRHLELAYQFVLSISDDVTSIFLPLLPTSCLAPMLVHVSEIVTWRRYYLVFTYIYTILIQKDICDCRNVSVKLPCVYVCLSSGDLLSFPYFETFPFRKVTFF